MTIKEFWCAMRVYLADKGIDLDKEEKNAKDWEMLYKTHGTTTRSIAGG